jgi:hypothetical protein
MKPSNWPDAHREALARFYSDGHAWTWQEMCDGSNELALRAMHWIESNQTPPNHALLLPRVRGEQVVWYAIAFDDRRFEALREELTAFLGRAGTDFNGVRAELDLSDPCEAVLSEWAGARRVFRINVIGQEIANVRKALLLYLGVCRAKPPKSSTAYRTTDALLREFFAALVNSDEPAALRAQLQLHEGGRLSAENINFLKVERNAAFGRWHDIVQMPELSLITRITRPRRITSLVAEALWRVDEEKWRADPQSAVDYFRNHVQGRFPILFRTRQGITSTAALLMFAIAAAAVEPANRNEIERLGSLLPGQSDREFIQTLLANFPGPVQPVSVPFDPLARAWDALGTDHYDEAWAIAIESEASLMRCRILISCAVEIATSETAIVALEAVDALSEADRNDLLRASKQARYVKELRELVEENVSCPDDWESWFEQLDRDPNTPNLVELAKRSTESWPISTYRTTPLRVTGLAERLVLNRSTDAIMVQMISLPNFLRYFLQEGRGEREFLPIYKASLILIAFSESFGESDWATAQTLLDAVLTAGANKEEYEDTIEALSLIWATHGNVHHLDWGLDTLDLLATRKACAPDPRDKFVLGLQETFRAGYRRVARHQWETFKVLSSDLGKDDEFNALNPPAFEDGATTNGELLPNLSGRKVGIYTLTESAGRHAATALEQMFSGIDVRLNNDKVSTGPLVSLARECDHLIVVADSSKHAATDALKANRPKGASPVTYAAGKGSSSIIAALLKVASL